MDLFRDALAAAAFSGDKMKKTNLFETERMFCDVYGLLPGQEQKGHVHAGSDKVYYVLAGTGTFTVDGNERQLAAGNAVFAPAGASHAVRNDSQEPLSLLVVMAPKP